MPLCRVQGASIYIIKSPRVGAMRWRMCAALPSPGRICQSPRVGAYSQWGLQLKRSDRSDLARPYSAREM
eukprot:9481956-Pyramimonas_sp.AAC.1